MIERIGNNIKKVKEKGALFGGEVRGQIATYLTGAFGLVAALAWNEAVKALIDSFFPASKDTVFAKFLYAIVITTIVVLVTAHLLKLLEKKKEEEHAEEDEEGEE